MGRCPRSRGQTHVTCISSVGEDEGGGSGAAAGTSMPALRIAPTLLSHSMAVACCGTHGLDRLRLLLLTLLILQLPPPCVLFDTPVCTPLIDIMFCVCVTIGHLCEFPGSCVCACVCVFSNHSYVFRKATRVHFLVVVYAPAPACCWFQVMSWSPRTTRSPRVTADAPTTLETSSPAESATSANLETAGDGEVGGLRQCVQCDR